ncbi:hypothetical protein QEW_4626 [Clostridioides difficile CD160]|nr:hypothetical protein QEW_4626 [Clostridioides difficile CD160]
MNEFFLEKEDTIIYKFYINDDFSADIIIDKTFLFLSYISVYDTQIYFSIDFSYIMFKLGHKEVTSIDNIIYTKKNEICNLVIELYLSKKESFKESLLEDDATHALFLNNKRDLFQQYKLMIDNFLESENCFSIKSLFECGLYVYCSIEDSNCYYQLVNILEDLFLQRKDEFTKEIYYKLQDEIDENYEITAYRGSKAKNINGFSYTLSYDQAKFFATRWDKNGGIIAKYKIKIKDIIAYTNIRKEKEVITKNARLIDKIILN